MPSLEKNLDPKYKDLINDLYKDLSGQMKAMALGLLKDPYQAEEAVANTFVKIIDHIEKISKIPCPQRQAYCVSILKNETINILRREKNYQATENLDSYQEKSSLSQVEAQIIEELEKTSLREKIKDLDQADRLLLIYKYQENMTYKEIGKILSISEEAAKKKGQRILKKLRDKYREEGQDER